MMNGMVALAQRGATVSEIRAGRTNSEIKDFNNIPILTVKKISKLYNDFLASGGKDEDFDIERKAHKRHNDTQRDNMVKLVPDMVDHSGINPDIKKKIKIWIFVYYENLGYLGKYRKGIMKKSLKMAKLWHFKKL